MRLSPRSCSAALCQLRRLFLSPLRSDHGSPTSAPRPSRFRRLFLEQFEDRRLLDAADDSFAVHANTTLTVTNPGIMANDYFRTAVGTDGNADYPDFNVTSQSAHGTFTIIASGITENDHP